MVGPGRGPYPDPVAVGFEPAFHGWPEQRVGPRDIPAEHQHVGAEAFRHGGCECRQPLPVFVEQAPCRGVFRMAFGSFACAAYLLPNGRQYTQPLAGTSSPEVTSLRPATKPDPTPVPSVSATTRSASSATPPRHSPSAKAAASLT